MRNEFFSGLSVSAGRDPALGSASHCVHGRPHRGRGEGLGENRHGQFINGVEVDQKAKNKNKNKARFPKNEHIGEKKPTALRVAFGAAK